LTNKNLYKSSYLLTISKFDTNFFDKILFEKLYLPCQNFLTFVVFYSVLEGWKGKFFDNDFSLVLVKIL